MREQEDDKIFMPRDFLNETDFASITKSKGFGVLIAYLSVSLLLLFIGIKVWLSFPIMLIAFIVLFLCGLFIVLYYCVFKMTKVLKDYNYEKNNELTDIYAIADISSISRDGCIKWWWGGCGFMLKMEKGLTVGLSENYKLQYKMAIKNFINALWLKKIALRMYKRKAKPKNLFDAIDKNIANETDENLKEHMQQKVRHLKEIARSNAKVDVTYYLVYTNDMSDEGKLLNDLRNAFENLVSGDTLYRFTEFEKCLCDRKGVIDYMLDDLDINYFDLKRYQKSKLDLDSYKNRYTLIDSTIDNNFVAEVDALLNKILK